MSDTMVASKNSAADSNAAVDVDVDLYPFIRKYKDGHIKRFMRSSFVPASEDPSASRGVASTDAVIDQETGVSARLFLPAGAAAAGRRLPLVLYVHGGSFCTGSAFCRMYDRYAVSLAARAGALVVSVDYRLAPECPLPAAYDDSWAALRWSASLSHPWLAEHADAGRLFLAGDSAGANIAYHTAARAAVDVEGLVAVHPFFWGPDRLPSVAVWDGAALLPAHGVDRLWPFVTAGRAGNDDRWINPSADEIASLTCRRALVAVAAKDTLRDRGRRFAACLRGGDVTLVESEGEDHCFHLFRTQRATSKDLMDGIVQFINQPAATSPLPASVLPALHAYASGKMDLAQPMLGGLPGRPFEDDAFRMKNRSSLITHASLNIGRAKATKTSYGLFVARMRPDKARKYPSAIAVPRSSMIMNFF